MLSYGVAKTLMETGRRGALLAASVGLVSLVGPRARAGPDRGEPLSNDVDPRDYGARYDGITDDSVPLQLAIDACAVDGRWKQLVISGPLRTTRSSMIDRPVDRSRQVFRISGRNDAQLIHNGPEPLFDSNITMIDHPVSEYVCVSGITFSGTGSIFSGKFLRVQILKCYIMGLSAFSTAQYVQSLEISHCRFVDAAALAIVSAKAGYDVTISYSHFERTGTVLQIGSVNGLSIVGCVFESCQGPVLDVDGVNGMLFNGNYVEENAGPAIVLGSKLGRSQGVSIFGNCIKGATVAANRYEIVLGRAVGVASGGNYCAGNLYDTSFVMLGDLHSIADATEGRLTSTDYPVSLVAAGTLPKAATLDLGSAPQSVPILVAPTTVVRGVTDKARTVALPISVSARFQREVTVINAGAGTLLVRAQHPAQIVGSNGIVAIESGHGARLVEYEAGAWCVI